MGQHEVLQNLGLDAETAARAHSSSLDEKTDALVCIGALVAMGAAPAPYLATIERAFAAGASTDEIVDTLVAVAATVGSSGSSPRRAGSQPCWVRPRCRVRGTDVTDELASYHAEDTAP